MLFKSLNDIAGLASGKGTQRLVVAVAQDKEVLLSVKAGVEAGLVQPVLVGNEKEIRKTADLAGMDVSNIEICHVADRQQACIYAVSLVKDNKGDILMKGMVSTSVLLRAVLDKEKGLITDNLLSHVALFETPFYHKLLCITDAALNISPDFNEKVSIVSNAVHVYHSLGASMPKVGILAAVETVNPKMEATVHASMLAAMQKRKQIDGCLIDGPLALDNAISREAADHKGIISEIAGDVDILLVPDLNAGNILYKSLIFLGGALAAAVVAGAPVPVVLTSRSDSEKSKFLSIALAVAMK